jgi:hypothetical protein
MVARRIALVKPASMADEKATHALQLFDSILWASHVVLDRAKANLAMTRRACADCESSLSF